MRQIGTLENPSEAQRFTAFLIAQGITAEAEDETGGWVIWVHDENDLEPSREALEQFRAEPNHPRYRDAEAAAERIRRAQRKKREEARKNQVEMRQRWNRSPVRRSPLVWVLVGLSVLVALATNFGGDVEPVQSYLSFSRVADIGGDRVSFPKDGFAQIKQGQLWRLVTPIFLHFGIVHLVFNMFVLYYLGSQVEDRRGTLRFAAMVLLIAVASNVAQYSFEKSPLFGGMSGVGYGLFGYVWVKSVREPEAGMFISPFNVALLLGWLIACILREVEPFGQVLAIVIPQRVANTAHVVGLVFGLSLAFLPKWLGR